MRRYFDRIPCGVSLLLKESAANNASSESHFGKQLHLIRTYSAKSIHIAYLASYMGSCYT